MGTKTLTVWSTVRREKVFRTYTETTIELDKILKFRRRLTICKKRIQSSQLEERGQFMKPNKVSVPQMHRGRRIKLLKEKPNIKIFWTHVHVHETTIEKGT